MAGIVAASSAKVHSDSGANASTSGFLTGEQISLTANPTGTEYLWALSIPATSNAARSALSGEDEARAFFTPDSSGIYTVTANVDGTVYTLQIAVVMLAQSTTLEALRCSPIADTQVAAPPVGAAIYWSSTQNALALKDADGDVFTFDLTAV